MGLSMFENNYAPELATDTHGRDEPISINTGI